jgi:hypothetical protein
VYCITYLESSQISPKKNRIILIFLINPETCSTVPQILQFSVTFQSYFMRTDFHEVSFQNFCVKLWEVLTPTNLRSTDQGHWPGALCLQLTFDSFTLGRFISFTADGCPDGSLQISEADRPVVGGSWCGTLWGAAIYYSETRTVSLSLRLMKLARDQTGYNFDYRMGYKMLTRDTATVRYGGSIPGQFLYVRSHCNISSCVMNNTHIGH